MRRATFDQIGRQLVVDAPGLAAPAAGRAHDFRRILARPTARAQRQDAPSVNQPLKEAKA
jgi:hypothetical protein